MRAKKSSERVLFFSLWTVLILITAMWKFWPKPIVLDDPLPSVVLAKELITWFQHARVTESSPTRYTVEVVIQPAYLTQLRGDSSRVHLAFHFLREGTVLSQGVVECVLNATGHLHVALPNPNRVIAKTIQLAIAN